MSAESYSLAEVAELLGVSKRTLQRQIRDGAFPGRFLAPSAHGMEMRIPAVDIVQAGGSPERLPARSANDSGWSAGQLATLSSLPTRDNAVLSPADVQGLRDGLMALIREERAVFLAEVRAVVERRDEVHASELQAVRETLQSLVHEVSEVKTEVKSWDDARRGAWAEAIGGKASELDVDGLLSELSELEAMLGVSDN